MCLWRMKWSHNAYVQEIPSIHASPSVVKSLQFFDQVIPGHGIPIGCWSIALITPQIGFLRTKGNSLCRSARDFYLWTSVHILLAVGVLWASYSSTGLFVNFFECTGGTSAIAGVAWSYSVSNNHVPWSWVGALKAQAGYTVSPRTD